MDTQHIVVMGQRGFCRYLLPKTKYHPSNDILRLCLPIIIWINIKSLPFNQGQKLVISSISFQLADTDINPFVSNPTMRLPAGVKLFFGPAVLHISCAYPNFKCRPGYFINLNSKGGMIMNFSKAGRCCLEYHRVNSKKKYFSLLWSNYFQVLQRFWSESL